jgi:molybdopterin-guanine dinucleotide biosynthesis protein B
VQELKPTIIAVVGSKKSGKTTTIEILTKELTKRSFRIAAVKHVPEPNFTIDREGKDTWKYAQSGAKTVISVAADEIATIEKIDRNTFSLEKILQKCKNSDIVFVEGFKSIISKRKDIFKIVSVKSAKEMSEAVRNYEPIVAFTGPYSIENVDPKIPYVDVMKEPTRIADLVEKIVREEKH